MNSLWATLSFHRVGDFCFCSEWGKGTKTRDERTFQVLTGASSWTSVPFIDQLTLKGVVKF